jgi:hypothetical protein
MKNSLLVTIVAAMFIFVSSCKKDDDTTPEDPGNSNPVFTGVNKVKVTINGNIQEFVFADENYKNSDTDASLTIGTKNTEYDSVYTEVTLAAAGVFDHVTLAAMTVSYFGTGTGTHDISYGLETGSGLDNFMGSSFMLMTDTSSMPILYFLEEATATITKYGDVNGYIEGSFQSTSVSLAGVPQPNVSISGNFKAIRFEDGK